MDHRWIESLDRRRGEILAESVHAIAKGREILAWARQQGIKPIPLPWSIDPVFPCTSGCQELILWPTGEDEGPIFVLRCQHGVWTIAPPQG